MHFSVKQEANTNRLHSPGSMAAGFQLCSPKINIGENTDHEEEELLAVASLTRLGPSTTLAPSSQVCHVPVSVRYSCPGIQVTLPFSPLVSPALGYSGFFAVANFGNYIDYSAASSPV